MDICLTSSGNLNSRLLVSIISPSNDRTLGKHELEILNNLLPGIQAALLQKVGLAAPSEIEAIKNLERYGYIRPNTPWYVLGYSLTTKGADLVDELIAFSRTIQREAEYAQLVFPIVDSNGWFLITVNTAPRLTTTYKLTKQELLFLYDLHRGLQETSEVPETLVDLGLVGLHPQGPYITGKGTTLLETWLRAQP